MIPHLLMSANPPSVSTTDNISQESSNVANTELISNSGHNTLYIGSRYGRRISRHQEMRDHRC